MYILLLFLLIFETTNGLVQNALVKQIKWTVIVASPQLNNSPLINRAACIFHGPRRPVAIRLWWLKRLICCLVFVIFFKCLASSSSAILPLQRIIVLTPTSLLLSLPFSLPLWLSPFLPRSLYLSLPISPSLSGSASPAASRSLRLPPLSLILTLYYLPSFHLCRSPLYP